MDTVLDRPRTTDSFLAWEDRQESKYEFNGREVIPMSGGSVAHQVIVFNLLVQLRHLLMDLPFWTLHAMRLRIGTRIRYPDVVIGTAPIDQTTRTLADAMAIFEVLSGRHCDDRRGGQADRLRRSALATLLRFVGTNRDGGHFVSARTRRRLDRERPYLRLANCCFLGSTSGYPLVNVYQGTDLPRRASSAVH